MLNAMCMAQMQSYGLDMSTRMWEMNFKNPFAKNVLLKYNNGSYIVRKNRGDFTV